MTAGLSNNGVTPMASPTAGSLSNCPVIEEVNMKRVYNEFDRNDVEPKESWFSKYFPVIRWVPTSPYELRDAEERLLSFVPAKSEGRYIDVGTLNGNPCRIWTRRFWPKDQKKTLWDKKGNCTKLPLVLIHGMASGIALFGLNFEGLMADERPVYAIDLPGFARSARPSFSSNSEEAEEQYVAAIEAWRKEVGLEKICLVGHSFGGYLSASYALKHPSKVAHLILADPWGFTERPKEIAQRFPWYARMIYSVVKQFNPLAAFRAAGPWGRNSIQRFRPELLRKFGALFESEEQNVEVISDYMYHCNAQSPTGESAFHSISDSLAWAKRPMENRIGALDKSVPLTVIYGGDSWITRLSEEKFIELRGKDAALTKVEVLPDAGHHVYADQNVLFNKEILKACAFSETDVTDREQ